MKRVTHSIYGAGTVIKTEDNNMLLIKWDSGVTTSVDAQEVRDILHS